MIGMPASSNVLISRYTVRMLILKRSENITHFLFVHKNLDPYVAYFKNRDKKEAKTTYKYLFDKFANSKSDIGNDRKFEKEVNEIF